MSAWLAIVLATINFALMKAMNSLMHSWLRNVYVPLKLSMESSEVREACLTNNCSRKIQARALKNDESRNARLAADRSRHAEACSFESNEERDSRLAADRERHCLMRSLESEEQHE